jgi:eukaryotic-like serine/threonine-protein kinase
MTTASFNADFPGYDILGELGRSNARVLKARHQATGDLVAIKHFTASTDPETLRRFGREADIMTGISHPNVVKIREVNLAATFPFIVMEYVEGGTVRDLIKTSTRLDIETTVRLGLQMIKGFRAIHPAGIIHRDIKPENILYRTLPSGELHFLLTDFGIARLQEQTTFTQTGQAMMTYEYASPEQFDNPKGVTAATDYYSLGVVLYECLNGTVPFPLTEQMGMATFMNRVLRDTPPPILLTPNGALPDSMNELLAGLLVKTPADRLADPAEVEQLLKRAELEAIQTDRRGPAIPPGFISQTLPAPRPASVVLPTPETVSQQPVYQEETANTSGSGRWVLWAAIAFVAVLVTIIIYLTNNPKRVEETTTTIDSATTMMGDSVIMASDSSDTMMGDESTMTGDSSDTMMSDSTTTMETSPPQTVETPPGVIAKVADYHADKVMGGITDVQLQIDNPTEQSFKSILVRVTYIKVNGDVHKTEDVYFYNVQAYSSPKQAAPDSNRGTDVRAEIVAFESAQ